MKHTLIAVSVFVIVERGFSININISTVSIIGETRIYKIFSIISYYTWYYLWYFFRLEQVLMQEGKIYLVFEYLSMDLRKYLDQNKNEPIAPELIKVC